MAAEVVAFPAAEREPMRAERRAAQRRRLFIERTGTAVSPREKLDAAVDYYRATISDHRVNPDKAGVATEHLAERLIASADQLAKTVTRRQR